MAFGDAPGRPNLIALWRAFGSLPRALGARRRAMALAAISETEAFARPLGAYYRDRFHPAENPEKLRVLFVSPYPICPPTHGGGVFMYQTLRELARLGEVHVVALLDFEHQIELHRELGEFCASASYLIRMPGAAGALGSIVPHAAREFENADLAWLIHRLVYTRRIDVIQLEYTPMAQYAMRLERLASVLFEHDIYFQSIGRSMEFMPGPLKKLQARFEYLRALRFEMRMLPRFDHIQVCTRENKEYLESFSPRLAPILKDGLRAGIDTSRYRFQPDGREPDTMLFLGSFRHAPNQVALDWFVRHVLAGILERRPAAKLVVVGSDPPAEHIYAEWASAIEFAGFVEDVREPLARCAIFVCPILSGSGVRVKLLEAFAAGIPVVSTRVGAEGLARVDGECCRIADSPEQFAAQAAELLADPVQAAGLALRARREVEESWDMAMLTRRLEASFREIVSEKAARSRPATASRRASSRGGR